MLITRKGDWLSAKVGEELVMLSAAKGNYIGLTEVGARIWELLAVPQDFDSVCRTLMTEFEVEPEICRAEVEAFLKELEVHDAIALDPAPAG